MRAFSLRTISKTACASAAVLALTLGATAAHADSGNEVPDSAAETILQNVAPETLEAVAPSDQFSYEDSTVELPGNPEDNAVLSSELGTIEVGLPFSDKAKPIETSQDGVAAFDNGNSSTSVAVLHDDASLQVNTIIASHSAPKNYAYPLTLPEGASLTPLSDGQILISDATGQDLGLIAAPWAKDSNGADVPTRYEVSNNTVTQVVDHSATNAYPIVADPVIVQTRYEYKYVNIKSYPNWTNKSQQLGICVVLKGAGGGTCTISNSYTATTEVSASFGLSKSVVSAGIGVNYSATASGSISWTSPRAAVGSRYKAWAVGTRKTYNIQKWRITQAPTVYKRTLDGTSGTLASFSPVKGFAVGQ